MDHTFLYIYFIYYGLKLKEIFSIKSGWQVAKLELFPWFYFYFLCCQKYQREETKKDTNLVMLYCIWVLTHISIVKNVLEFGIPPCVLLSSFIVTINLILLYVKFYIINFSG